MGQLWYLINVDTCEAKGGAKLIEMMFFSPEFGDKYFTEVVKLLARPTGFIRHTRWLDPDKGRSPPERDGLGRLEILPDEILLLVMESAIPARLLNKFDVHNHHLVWAISFALTNSYLAELAYPLIQRAFMQYASAWSLDRLICVGSEHYITYSLPPTLDAFTDSELKEMEEYGVSALYEFLTKEYDNCDRWRGSPYTTKLFAWDVDNALQTSIHRWQVSRWPKFGEYLADLTEPRLEYDQPYTSWVLSNLTKAEYIRLEALVEFNCIEVEASLTFGPWAGCDLLVSLAELLVIRIFWSPHYYPLDAPEGRPMSYPNTGAGPWAGDRFEITTLDRLRPRKQGVRWKDISETAMEDLDIFMEAWCEQYTTGKWVRGGQDGDFAQ
ncbi:hypothetical protein K474DRAFT_1712224 [Panus rudis PR-1116 ss-1]|nr:hypothetical protein K474DRAFT_1712224 [Panus rudis PR-1116 ss-1]